MLLLTVYELLTMAKATPKLADVDGESSLQYVLDEDVSHLPFTEQRFLRILVNPVDVVSNVSQLRRSHKYVVNHI